MLFLSGIKFDKKEDLFDQTKKSLKKCKGDIATGGNVSGSTAAVKLEPAFVTTVQKEASATSAHLNQRGRSGFRSRDLKQHDAFNRTWWLVLSIDKLVTWQHLAIERTGHHVMLKASRSLRSLVMVIEDLRILKDDMYHCGAIKRNEYTRSMSPVGLTGILGGLYTLSSKFK